MVKVYAPALSLDASGSLAGALVFSKWKGRNYVRQLVTPANPKSGGQVGIRAMFKFLTQDWTNLSAGQKSDWDTRADQMIVSPFNAFVSYNMARWRNFESPSKEDPAAEAGAQSSLNIWTATAGVRHVTLTIRVDAPNDGWGVAFFRSTTTGFNSAFANAIGMITFTPGIEMTFIDSPLVPDTYYYQARTFTVDGLKAAEAGERDATPT